MSGALSIATRGYICLPPKDFVQAITCQTPDTRTVVEVRPTMRGTYEPPTVEPVPQVAAATPVAPITESASNEQAAAVDAPAVASTTVLQPIIVSAEEE